MKEQAGITFLAWLILAVIPSSLMKVTRNLEQAICWLDAPIFQPRRQDREPYLKNIRLGVTTWASGLSTSSWNEWHALAWTDTDRHQRWSSKCLFSAIECMFYRLNLYTPDWIYVLLTRIYEARRFMNFDIRHDVVSSIEVLQYCALPFSILTSCSGVRQWHARMYLEHSLV